MRNNRTLFWVAGFVALTLAGVSSASERSASARRAAPKRIAYRTSLPPLPSSLKVEAPRARDKGVRSGALAEQTELSRRARLAAHWAAEVRVSNLGLGESFRVGFFDGQREAWSDPWLGVADLEDGRSDGLRDPDARRAGRDAGREAAELQALELAAIEVEAQFRDLSREPQAELSAPSAEFAGALPRYTPLSLRELIEAQSFAQLRLEPRWGRHLMSWSVSPWQLHNCADQDDFYLADWASPAEALALVAVDSRHSRFYQRMTPAEREAFAFYFERAFAHRIAVQFESALEEAYQEGFQNGWSWGAWIREEAAYEEGYSSGAQQRAEQAALRSFDRTFEGSFLNAYDAEFAHWSSRAVLEIGAIEAIDVDRDGVFAPGDEVELWVDWINYGGAGTQAQLAVEGRELIQSARAVVNIQPRQRSVQPVRLLARIDERAANGQLDAWQIELDNASATLETRIQTPLQLSRPRVIARDVEQGELTVVVDVQNISTQARSAALVVRAAPWAVAQQELGAVSANARVPVELVLSEIDGLEIIAGNVRLEVELNSSRAAHAVRRVESVSGSAQDLSSDELHRWIVRYGADRAIDAASTERARELLVARLRVDWRRAIKGRGNPYKRDLKRGTAKTEVGEWVRLQQAQRSAGSVNVVLQGLNRELDRAADDLPGAHPFLRKALRRLAARLT